MSDHAHFSSLMLGLFHSCGAHNIGPDESQRADSEPVVCLQLAEHTANWEPAENIQPNGSRMSAESATSQLRTSRGL